MRLVFTLVVAAMLTIAVGCEKPKETKPATPAAPAAGAAAETTSVTFPVEGDLQLVSLKLPAMHWGGCEASVRGALTKVEGLKDLETDISSRACSFKAPKDMNVAAKLNEIVAAGNTHVKGWAKN